MSGYGCIVMGAAGRDFHDFLTFFRTHPEFRVRCFTAHQIPFIENRVFPKELAPPGYDDDIPIHLEEELPALIERYHAQFVFLSYSDLPHEEVMHKVSIVQAAGASFVLLGPAHTQLRSRRPVLAVTAVRTGAGKSPLSRALAAHLQGRGLRVGVLRHPMPYGDLRRQAVQRFATEADLDHHECTVEEREEYQPYVEQGMVVWAGVDYERILRKAEEESDVILWDGGNNDLSFVQADLTICVADALRAGHEVRYYPGESGFRAADVIVLNKVGKAEPAEVERLRRHAEELAPRATVVESDLDVAVDRGPSLRGKRLIAVEDGPTLTHGGMSHGAATLAARQYEAELVDPRPHAVGTIRAAYEAFPHLGDVLPALGYSRKQREELAETIRAAAPDAVLDASPASLERVIDCPVPVHRVRYSFSQRSGPDLFDLVDARFVPPEG